MPFDACLPRPTPVKTRWSHLAELRQGGVERLMLPHWRESAAHQADVPLNPNWAQYEALETANVWRCMAAWQDGAVVGYASYIISPHMQFQSTVYVLNNSIYVEPGHRGIAPSMMRKAARLLAYQLRPYTVVIVYEAPNESFAKVLDRMGYPQTGTVHARVFKP